MQIPRTFKAFATVFSLIGISSCSVHPSTKDISGLDGAWIAQAIRCEMRDAWIEQLVGAIKRVRANAPIADQFNRRELDTFVPVSPVTDLIELRVLRARNESKIFSDFLTLGYKKVEVGGQPDTELQQVVETYKAAYIGYKFLFDITSTDSLSANVNFLSIVSRGTLTSPIGGSFEGKRQATLEFALADHVEELFTNIPTISTCYTLRKGERPSNAAYPIVGRLNLKEYVSSFITANQSGNLIGQFDDAQLLTSADKPPLPSMNKSLKFTTTISGGIKDAKLELNPQLSGTAVKGAGLSLGSERVDVHKLVLVMQLPALGGLTVAQARDKAARAQQNEQAIELAKELRRLDDRDKDSRLYNLLIGQ